MANSKHFFVALLLLSIVLLPSDVTSSFAGRDERVGLSRSHVVELKLRFGGPIFLVKRVEQFAFCAFFAERTGKAGDGDHV